MAVSGKADSGCLADSSEIGCKEGGIPEDIGSILDVFAKSFHETNVSLGVFEQLLTHKLDPVDLFLAVFEYESFSALDFSKNSALILRIMSKPFVHEYLILLPLYFNKIGVDCDTCCLILDALAEIEMENLENFCVIARLLSEYPKVMWPALTLKRHSVFTKLLSSRFFRPESLLSIGRDFNPLVVNKFYSLFKVVSLEYALSEKLIPSVISPVHCLQTVCGIISKTLFNCPENFIHKFYLLFINLVETVKNTSYVYRLIDLENIAFDAVVTVLIEVSQKIEESSLRKNVVSALNDYIKLFDVQSRVVLIHKVSTNFENDDNASSLLLTWLKGIFSDGSKNIRKLSFPNLFLKSFTILRSDSLLEAFNRHLCVINLLIYLHLSKKRKVFRWKHSDSNKYAENLDGLIEKTRMLVNTSENDEEVEVAVGKVDTGEKLTVSANEAKRNQILMNINLFEFRLNSLKGMVKNISN